MKRRYVLGVCIFSAMFSMTLSLTALASDQTVSGSNAVCQHIYQTWECTNQRLNPVGVSHGYGLFWASTCNTTVYHSKVRHFCPNCKASMPWLDTNDQHECVQVHQNCGKGTQKICTIIGG